jgi:hypothetical protein
LVGLQAIGCTRHDSANCSQTILIQRWAPTNLEKGQSKTSMDKFTNQVKWWPKFLLYIAWLKAEQKMCTYQELFFFQVTAAAIVMGNPSNCDAECRNSSNWWPDFLWRGQVQKQKAPFFFEMPYGGVPRPYG